MLWIGGFGRFAKNISEKFQKVTTLSLKSGYNGRRQRRFDMTLEEAFNGLLTSDSKGLSSSLKALEGIREQLKRAVEANDLSKVRNLLKKFRTDGTSLLDLAKTLIDTAHSLTRDQVGGFINLSVPPHQRK